MNNTEFASSLRALADFYEARPNLPQPDTHLMAYMREDAVQPTMGSIGNCEKQYNGSVFAAIKSIGELKVHFVTSRDNVCERVVVGTREVPARYIEAHTEDIVEWECHPVLQERALQAAAYAEADQAVAA